MANNIKYAQNLVGDWNKDIYEPKKQVLQDIYQTNWDKISNDYNTLKDTLARNYNVARQSYSNALNDIQNESFNRMNAATIDLANRGLTSSGVGSLVQKADTSAKGEDVNKALSSLLNTGNQTAEGLMESANTLGRGQNTLANNLLGDLGGLTDADAANMQQYAGLVSGIAENEASRASSRAISNAENNNAEEEFERRRRIALVLESADYDDEEKTNLLVRYLDVPLAQARNAISAYNYDMVNNKLSSAQNTLNDYISKNNLNASLYTPEVQDIINNANVNNTYLARLLNNDRKGISPSNYTDQVLLDAYRNSLTGNLITKNRARNMVNKVNNLRDDLSNYTYGDIYNILYGGR